MTEEASKHTRVDPWIPAGHPLFKWTSGSDVQARWRRHGWTPPSDQMNPPILPEKVPDWVQMMRRVK